MIYKLKRDKMEENYMATERAASGEPNLFGLSRVVSEEDQRATTRNVHELKDMYNPRTNTLDI